jgi:hypothetical protein
VVIVSPGGLADSRVSRPAAREQAARLRECEARRTLAVERLYVAADSYRCLLMLLATWVADPVRFGYLQQGRDELMSVRFAWNPLLVELRREVCPNARWQKRNRHWLMSVDDAERFLRAAQARPEFVIHFGW